MAASRAFCFPLISVQVPGLTSSPPRVSVLPRRQNADGFKVRAAKLPSGVEVPKEEPRVQPPLLGFTRTAEVWNSRACMIGLIGTFFVELILNKGILEILGVEVGKGLNLPL